MNYFISALYGWLACAIVIALIVTPQINELTDNNTHLRNELSICSDEWQAQIEYTTRLSEHAYWAHYDSCMFRYDDAEKCGVYAMDAMRELVDAE